MHFELPPYPQSVFPEVHMSKLESLMQRAGGGGNGVVVCVCVCVFN